MKLNIFYYQLSPLSFTGVSEHIWHDYTESFRQEHAVLWRRIV